MAQVADKLAKKGATSIEIVEQFKKSHPEILIIESADLIDIALIQLTNRVCSKRSDRLTKSQIEMFSEYAIDPKITIINSKGEKIHKSTMTVTIEEASEYITRRIKPRINVPNKISELQRFVSDMEDEGYDQSSTLGQCWEWSKKAA